MSNINCELSDIPLIALRGLVEKNSLSMLEDWRKVESIMNDTCPNYRTENFILSSVIRENIPRELLDRSIELKRRINEAERKIQQNLHFDKDTAAWAVNSWVTILRIINSKKKERQLEVATQKVKNKRIEFSTRKPLQLIPVAS